MRSPVVVFAWLLLAACGAESSQKQAISAQGVASQISGETFAVARIDDTVDPLENVKDEELPAGQGMAIFSERSMVSGARLVQIHFVRTVSQEGETSEHACSRFLSWTQKSSMTLPAGDRWACEPMVEYDQETKQTTPIGVRSYVLTGEPLITKHDVIDAYLGEDLKSEDDDFLDVAVKLSPEGRAHLKAGTGDWIHRRMALMANGMVTAAPLVKGEIDSDTLTIAFGQRSPAELDKAQAFIRKLLEK